MRHKPSQITDQVKGTVCSLRTTEDKLDLQLQYISLSEVDFQILVTGRVYCDSFWICRSYFLLLRLCPLTRYHSSLARHRIVRLFRNACFLCCLRPADMLLFLNTFVQMLLVCWSRLRYVFLNFLKKWTSIFF